MMVPDFTDEDLEKLRLMGIYAHLVGKEELQRLISEKETFLTLANESIVTPSVTPFEEMARCIGDQYKEIMRLQSEVEGLRQIVYTLKDIQLTELDKNNLIDSLRFKF